ncbi:hypothetical protein EK904_007913 [Melospiza melodia maxima]|nr:hypothetical protein EK904_007913 [Melospiza melodia maxima]
MDDVPFSKLDRIWEKSIFGNPEGTNTVYKALSKVKSLTPREVQTSLVYQLADAILEGWN